MRLFALTVRLSSEWRFGSSATKPMRRRSCRRRFCAGISDWRGFEQRSAFGTWIYRIAVNCALNRISQPGIEAEYRHGEESDPEEKTVQVATQEADPERVLLSREISAAQEMAMQRLTPTEKSAFVLRHLEDRSTSEIAEVLGNRSQCGEAGGISRGAEVAAGTGAAAGERMKHLSEDELIELYYGEGTSAANAHLRACRECSRSMPNSSGAWRRFGRQRFRSEARTTASACGRRCGRS